MGIDHRKHTERLVKILFVGETWCGSSARSLRDALSACKDVQIDDVGEDHYFPRYRGLLLRLANRLLSPWQHRELERAILSGLASGEQEVLVVYKGRCINKELVEIAKARGLLTVNVFPDLSPHVHGHSLRSAIGSYDLVISAKPFHPEGWSGLYGYSNRCVCVPHGYDPAIHLWDEPPLKQPLDVVLAATWREEYGELVQSFAHATSHARLKVGIAGAGWLERRSRLPKEWEFVGPLAGRSYSKWLRQGKIVISPVQTRVVIAGRCQPGDEDTTRTYELAAAYCFFAHKRTPFVQTVYDERREVPMWGDVEELASLVMHYLPREGERRAMAAAAHARAVPHYSIPSRAQQVLDHIRQTSCGMGAS